MLAGCLAAVDFSSAVSLVSQGARTTQRHHVCSKTSTMMTSVSSVSHNEDVVHQITVIKHKFDSLTVNMPLELYQKVMLALDKGFVPPIFHTLVMGKPCKAFRKIANNFPLTETLVAACTSQQTKLSSVDTDDPEADKGPRRWQSIIEVGNRSLCLDV
jgi:hypothetical protein